MGQSSIPSVSPSLWEGNTPIMQDHWNRLSGVSHQSENLSGEERRSTALARPHLSPKPLLELAEFIFLLEERQGFVETFGNLGYKQRTLFTFTQGRFNLFLEPQPNCGKVARKVASFHSDIPADLGNSWDFHLHLFLLGCLAVLETLHPSTLHPCHSNKLGCRPLAALPASFEAQTLWKNQQTKELEHVHVS